MGTEPIGTVATGPGSKLALGVLVGLTLLSPWPFGSVEPWATRAIALLALATALLAGGWDLQRRELRIAAGPAYAWLGLWLLGVLQLAPLPAGLHAWLAPGSASVWHPEVGAAAAVLGSGLFPISVHPDATRRWLSLTAGLAALALLAAPALRDRKQMLRATVAIVAGAGAIALYGLVARLVFGEKIYGVWSVPTVAPFGPFVSKNHFAGYVELAALLAVGLAVGLSEEARRDRGWLSWIESRRAKWIVLAWGGVLVLTLAVVVSLSRGGVVSLAAGLVAFVLLRLWTRRDSRLSSRGLVVGLVLLTCVGTATAALLPADVRARIASLGAVTTEASGSYRLAVWRDTHRLIASSPLVGSGFGAFEDALRRFRTASGEVSVEHAESDLLELAAEAGVSGLALASTAIGLVLWAGLRTAREDRRPLSRALSLGAISGTLALAAHSLFDFNLHLPSNGLLAGALLAFLLASATDPRPRASLALAVMVTAAIGLAVGVATTWRPARLDPGPLLRAASAATSLRRATLETTITAHLRRRPADAEGWLALAWFQQATSAGSARPLASWAVQLDPTNAGVRRAAIELASRDGSGTP
jgi:O-antigen ligase